ncbi:hypothetical protein Cgig2_004361 [Carnegiea gigantea]|uniref:Uncharacterized protein n=1 Tax=Carnegiea gigantea TaxID=171969 RepID=A0A9Q1GU56_9CARY|nr:hypothetical protein Cgig2_004361 [Carnegiea gigantea]
MAQPIRPKWVIQHLPYAELQWRVHKPMVAENLHELVGGRRSGFDSLAGKMGYDSSHIEELYLLNPTALLPCFVILSGGSLSSHFTHFLVSSYSFCFGYLELELLLKLKASLLRPKLPSDISEHFVGSSILVNRTRDRTAKQSEHLTLSATNMTANDPVGAIRWLQRLLTPLPELVNLKQIKYLDLGGNYFSDWNSLTGKLPSSLSQLLNIQELHLGYSNTFEGRIPPEWNYSSSLIVPDLASCDLNGTIPSTFGRLKQLEYLFSQENSLPRRRIPKCFSQLKQLELLHLFGNKMDGPIPGFIGDLSNLHVLYTILNLGFLKILGRIEKFILMLDFSDCRIRVQFQGSCAREAS